ncbi:MAG: response regulator [Opitutaceae bacterium]|nr:response regulator [Opitutaceae bacterium]
MTAMSPATVFRILLIDDTPAIHDDFRKVLTPDITPAPQIEALATAIFGAASATPPPSRFELDSAAQGQTGLALAQDALTEGRPYAVAFVDMRMPPGWDGLETIRRLWGADPHLQVVICTAYSDHSWSVITERLGQSDNLLILKKPFDHIEVLQITHALTRKWSLAREIAAHMAGLDDRLRAAEEGFTAAFEANPIAQAIVSLERRRILAINPAFEKTLGLGNVEAASLTFDSGERFFDPAHWKTLLAHLATGAAIDDHTCVFRATPESPPRPLLCSARPLTIRGERCSIWVLRDATGQIESASRSHPAVTTVTATAA